MLRLRRALDLILVLTVLGGVLWFIAAAIGLWAVFVLVVIWGVVLFAHFHLMKVCHSTTLDAND